MARARRTDPLTSHEAAGKVTNTTLTQNAILWLLQYPMSDDRLIDNYYSMSGVGQAPNASPSGIRSRRAELVARGLVEDSGEREKLPSGRNAIVWRLKELEVEAA